AGVSEDEAKRILEFIQSNSNSHSAWLTFMYPRLYIAKQLLKDDGVIFVSIDDNEVAQLRLLMDEVFGEENFIDTIIWKKKYGGGAKEKYLVSVHEYVLIYAKDKNNLPEILVDFDLEKARKFYKYKDENFEKLGYYRTHPLEAVKSFDIRENLNYPIEAPDSTLVYPKRQWRWSKETYEENKHIVLFTKSKDGGWTVSTKQYLNDEDGNQRKTKFQSLIDDVFTQEGTKEILTTLGNAKIFGFPKPLRFLYKLFEIGGLDQEEILLDFFAGSGSSQSAIFDYNETRKSSIKCISVQLPELIDSKRDKDAYDLVKNELGVTQPTIFEITKERIIRAAKQIKDSKTTKIVDAKKEIEKLKQELPTEETLALISDLENKINHWQQQDLGFKIFETTPIWEDYDFRAEKLANAEKLFDDEKLTEDDVKALFTTWKTYD